MSTRHEKLLDAFEHADAAVFVVSNDGRCIAANSAASALTGYTPEEIVGLPAGALNAFADEGTTHRLETQRGLRHEGFTHLLRRDRAIVDVRFAAAPTVVDGQPAVIAFCWRV